MQLAIVGAGVAGLAAARKLRERHPELAITIYEKSRGFGGRVATRRRDGYVFDHGAQYIKSSSPQVDYLLTKELPSADLRDIAQPVWVFDGAGTIAEGDAKQNAEPKWTYRDGLNRLGKSLAEGLDVRREVRVGRIIQRTAHGQQIAGYSLLDIDEHQIGEADLVLLTPPAPQVIDILAASELDASVKDVLTAEFSRVRYRRCISLALAYNRRIERPFYALVNTDRVHPISWLALEHEKGPERCPPGHSLLIPQMAPQWSLDHWESSLESLQEPVVEQISALLGEDLRAPLWCDVQRWRYALPDGGADSDALNETGSGLFFAGDYTTGQGRVHLAIESGWRVANLIERVMREA